MTAPTRDKSKAMKANGSPIKKPNGLQSPIFSSFSFFLRLPVSLMCFMVLNLKRECFFAFAFASVFVFVFILIVLSKFKQRKTRCITTTYVPLFLYIDGEQRFETTKFGRGHDESLIFFAAKSMGITWAFSFLNLLARFLNFAISRNARDDSNVFHTVEFVPF